MDTPTKGTHEGPIVMLGLGHVGLTLSLGLADVGFTVYGFDLKESVRDETRSKVAHFKEKGLQDLLDRHVGTSFHIVDRLEDVPRTAGLPHTYIVTVGTPFKFDNTPDYSFIEGAADTLGHLVQKGDLIILRSTVPLGTTRDVVIPRLEKASRLRVGEDISVAFAPERTVEGNAFEELRTLPQVIGGFDSISRARTEAIFGVLAETLVLLDSLEEAEIVKLINNTYRETVFAFANQVSMLARSWGLDTKKVIKAANTGYARSQVPFPSPGVGGYCLTKDGYLFKESARKKYVDTRLLLAVRETSGLMLDMIAHEIREFARTHYPRKKVKVGVLGFAFKGVPATSDVRGSTTQALIKRFTYERSSFDFIGFDPYVDDAVIRTMKAEPRASIEAVIEESDIVLIMNNNPAFATVTPALFPERADIRLLFDMWGLCQKDAFAAHPTIVYTTL